MSEELCQGPVDIFCGPSSLLGQSPSSASEPCVSEQQWLVSNNLHLSKQGGRSTGPSLPVSDPPSHGQPHPQVSGFNTVFAYVPPSLPALWEEQKEHMLFVLVFSTASEHSKRLLRCVGMGGGDCWQSLHMVDGTGLRCVLICPFFIGSSRHVCTSYS